MSADVARHLEALTSLERGPREWTSVVARGQAAVPALAELLGGASESVAQPRCLAAAALGAIGGRSAREVLRLALADSVARDLDPVLRQAEDEVVAAIADALVRRADAEDVEALVSALARRPIAGCARALGVLRARDAVPALVACLFDATASDAAAAALVRIGEPAVQALAAVALRTRIVHGYEGATSVRARALATTIFGRIGGPGSDLPLAALLWDSQRDVGFSAALALAARGPDGAAVAMPVLLTALADERWFVAAGAEAALEAALEAAAGAAVLDRGVPAAAGGAP